MYYIQNDKKIRIDNDGSIIEKYTSINCNTNTNFLIYLITSFIFILITSYIVYTISRRNTCYTLLSVFLTSLIAIIIWNCVFTHF
jgi:hypothetical protein